MGIWFNPAGPLTANKVPYALGGGRMGDSNMTYTAAQSILSVVGGGSQALIQRALVLSGTYGGGVTLADGGKLAGFFVGELGARMHFYQGLVGGASVNDATTQMTLEGGDLLLGLSTSVFNGRLQLGTHTTRAGGIGFGTPGGSGALYDEHESLFRAASQVLRTAARLDTGNIRVGYNPATGHPGYLIAGLGAGTGLLQFRDESTGSSARLMAPVASGWGLPTGTLTRTTFDPATVTLPQLAERVAALLTDLHTGGTRHQLLGV